MCEETGGFSQSQAEGFVIEEDWNDFLQEKTEQLTVYGFSVRPNYEFGDEPNTLHVSIGEMARDLVTTPRSEAFLSEGKLQLQNG